MKNYLRWLLLLLLFLFTPFTAPRAAEQAPQRLRVVFTGDIMVHDVQLDIARTAEGRYDFAPQFAAIAPWLNADVLVGNFETTLSGTDRPYAGYPSFNTPDNLADVLKELGYDVLFLANNHILDHSTKGALRTRAVLEEKGFAVAGIYPGPAAAERSSVADAKPSTLVAEAGSAEAGSAEAVPAMTEGVPAVPVAAVPVAAVPVSAEILPAAVKTMPADSRPVPPGATTAIFDAKGFRLGFLNYTYGSNRPISPEIAQKVQVNVLDENSVENIKSDIAYLRAQGVHYLVASFHWGVEYQSAPNVHQKKVADLCLSLGVDAVIGTHPHVLQPVEVRYGLGIAGFQDQVVAWSLGNFISSQRTLPRERAVILALDLIYEAPESAASAPSKKSLLTLPVTGLESLVSTASPHSGLAAPALLPAGKLRLERLSVLPTWVDLVAGKHAQVLPALPLSATANFDSTLGTSFLGTSALPPEQLARKLNQVNSEVCSFLKLNQPDMDTFYSLYTTMPSHLPTNLILDWNFCLSSDSCSMACHS